MLSAISASWVLLFAVKYVHGKNADKEDLDRFFLFYTPLPLLCICKVEVIHRRTTQMSPLEITLVILLVTIIAFVYGKVPFSVISTGIILALNMPVGMPLWIAVVGAFVAIVITKQLFGAWLQLRQPRAGGPYRTVPRLHLPHDCLRLPRPWPLTRWPPPRRWPPESATPAH